MKSALIPKKLFAATEQKSEIASHTKRHTQRNFFTVYIQIYFLGDKDRNEENFMSISDTLFAFRNGEIVRLLSDCPHLNLKAGDQGYVWSVYDF